jgi:hypothetical protein
MADSRITSGTLPAVRVVRLATWLLEVVREAPGKPWDVATSTHMKRRDAERAAKESP